MPAIRVRLSSLMLLALLVACGGGGAGAPRDLSVSGRLQANWSAGSCGTPAGDLGAALAESFVGARLTFRDGGDTIVGVATAGQLDSEPSESDGCVFFARFEVELKRADFYQVEYDIENWGDSSQEEPITYEELEGRNFGWTIDLGTF